MKIGTLATHTGLSVQAIRYYEQQQLLPEPVRSAGNYRVYDEAAARQLLFIKHCRNLGLALEEIRVLLRVRTTPDEACTEINLIVDAQRRCAFGRITGSTPAVNCLAHEMSG
jgi:DNA-binding transcriptional MerR regulator